MEYIISTLDERIWRIRQPAKFTVSTIQSVALTVIDVLTQFYKKYQALGDGPTR